MTTTLGIRFDLRVPSFAPTTAAAQYQSAVEMCRWADRVGLDFAMFSEHHGSPDGYLPAPLTMVTAVASCTSSIGLSVGALVLPLHDPVRIAEQAAVIDLLAPGRLTIIVGAGYREEEFAMAGVDFQQRGVITEEYVGVLRSAWTAEPFEWCGRSITVTPPPVTSGGPLIMLGGASRAAARRAARLHAPFMPSVVDPAVEQEYYRAAAAAGYEHAFCVMSDTPAFVMIAEDPEAAWQQIGPNVLHDAQMYRAWQEGVQASNLDVSGALDGWETIRSSGVYRVLTPDECIEFINSECRDGSFALHPLMGGIHPALAWESLDLFEAKVLPAIAGR